MNRESQHEALFKVHRDLTACASDALYAADEKGLFQAVCNALVRTGLFQFAWFGYRAENARRVGEPIALAGDAHGFLEDLKLALNRDDYEDPASVCLRTEDICWIKDIAAHTGMGPIRSALLRCGYTSVISAPMVSRDIPYGALTLYYSDPEAFGQDIVSVLKEKLAHVQAAFMRRSPIPERRSEQLEAELRSLIDVLPINIGLTDAEGLLLHVNRRVLETTGYTVEDHLFRGAMQKYVHPDDLSKVYMIPAQAFTQGVCFEFEVRHLRKDNQYHWVLVHGTPIRDKDGHITSWVSTGTDIQLLKQAEEKLRQSEADLLEAQRISHTGSWKHDLASGVVSVTPQVVEMFGMKEDASALTAEMFFSRIHPEDRPLEAIRYERAAADKADFESDYRIVLPEGSVRHVHNIGHPKLNEAGDLVEFVGTVIDVTAAKEAEETIRRSDREARQLLDFSPLHITLLGTDETRIYNNRAALDYYGLTLRNGRPPIFRSCFIRGTRNSPCAKFPANCRAVRRSSTKRG